MKDPTTIQLLITSITGIATTILAVMLPFLLKRMEAKQAAKLEEYRKEVNGHMSTILETTSKLAAAEATLVEKEKGEVKAAELKATVAITTPTTVPPITVDKVVVEAKEVNIGKPEEKPEDKT